MEKIIKVLFDLDDTLVNHSKAEIDAAEKFGFMFSSIIPNYDESTFVTLWKTVSENHIKDFLTQKITFREQQIRRIRDIFQNQKMTEHESFKYFNKYLGYYENSWTLYPDVIETLEFLKHQNIELGILSDGAQKQQEFKLKKTGIFEYFKFVITAESEGMSKPNPIFFQKSAELFKVESKNVIYIGDNLKKDAIGATDAGLLGIWLNRKRSNFFYEKSCSDLRELKEMQFFQYPHQNKNCI